MKTGTTIVTFYRKRTRHVLHRKIVANSSSSIANEIKSRRKTTARKKVVKEIVESALRRTSSAYTQFRC